VALLWCSAPWTERGHWVEANPNTSVGSLETPRTPQRIQQPTVFKCWAATLRSDVPGGSRGQQPGCLRKSREASLAAAFSSQNAPGPDENLHAAFRRWYKTRDFSEIVAGNSRFGWPFALWDHRPCRLPCELEAGRERRAAIRRKSAENASLGARDFEAARIADQRLLSLGAEPRSRWLFQLGAGPWLVSGRDREIFGPYSPRSPPLDHAGYLPAHLFIAQAPAFEKPTSSVAIFKTAEVPSQPRYFPRFLFRPKPTNCWRSYTSKPVNGTWPSNGCAMSCRRAPENVACCWRRCLSSGGNLEDATELG